MEIQHTSEVEDVADDVRAIVRLMENGKASSPYSMFEFFVRSLAIWEMALSLNDQDVSVPPEEWEEATRGMETALPQLTEALGILIAQGRRSYHDILGLVYQELELADTRYLAQEFTPAGVGTLLSRILLLDLTPPSPSDPPLTFHDPTCGDGGLLLSVADELAFRLPGAIEGGDVQFTGQEINATVARMARLNAVLHGLNQPRSGIREQQGDETS